MRLVVNRTHDERSLVVAHIENALRPRLSTQRMDEGDPGVAGFEDFWLATGDWREELQVYLEGLIAVKRQSNLSLLPWWSAIRVGRRSACRRHGGLAVIRGAATRVLVRHGEV